MPFVNQPCVVVYGYEAVLLAELTREAVSAGWLDEHPANHRDNLLQLSADLRRAGEAWREAGGRATSVAGNSETETHPVEAQSDDMDIDEAATVLDLTPRRVRQLAPELGRKAGGRWLLDRGLVADELARRQEAA